jgi:hypothetical protein
MSAAATVSTVAVTAGVRKGRSACAERRKTYTHENSADSRMLFHDFPPVMSAYVFDAEISYAAQGSLVA